jgi:hypothetical protein
VSAATRTGRAVFVVGLAALAAKLSVAGCDDGGVHIFTGEQYNATLQCLEPVASIDVIDGPEPGSCPAVCILTVPQDGGQLAYVSTLCGPYPQYPFEADASSDPLCIAAMNAYRINALCEDGGVVVLGDAGVDAKSEAGSEAGADAGVLLAEASAGDANEGGVDAGGD